MGKESTNIDKAIQGYNELTDTILGRFCKKQGFKDFGFAQNTGDMNTAPKDLNYPDSYTSINSYISYDLPLFTGFALYHQKGILKLQEKANEILYNLDKKNLEFEVLKAYNSAVLAKDFVN